MGDRGPAPRREAERRRTNDKGKAQQIGVSDLQELPFEVDLAPSPGAAPAHWPDVVKELWDALLVDPARKWMTAADWASTKLVLELLSTAMTAKDSEGNLLGVSANNQTAVLKHLSSIGVTEAARLRLQKEVTLFPVKSRTSQDGEVVDIRDARRKDVQ